MQLQRYDKNHCVYLALPALYCIGCHSKKILHKRGHICAGQNYLFLHNFHNFYKWLITTI